MFDSSRQQQQIIEMFCATSQPGSLAVTVQHLAAKLRRLDPALWGNDMRILLQPAELSGQNMGVSSNLRFAIYQA